MHNNTVDSIKAALKIYDGCEFDVRLAGDGKLVMYHNPVYKGKRVLGMKSRDMTGIDLFLDLLADEEVLRYVNDRGKELWIEVKEDKGLFLKTDDAYCASLGRSVSKALGRSDLDLERIRIISFCPNILYRVKNVRTLRIFPYLFSTATTRFPIRNQRTFYNIFTPLDRHFRWAQARGLGGVLFSLHYLEGFFSRFHPSYKEILKYHTDDFILGTGTAKSRSDEEPYGDMVVITDYRGKRGRKKRKAPLICHRGLGPNPPY